MSTKDVIKAGILESLSAGTYLDAKVILGILFFSVLMGVYIYLIYRFSAKTAFYSKDLNITMAGMPIVVAAIMIAMQANLLVSLGMVGALSIVRFRTAVKNPLDLMFLFWTISAGIICGVNLKALALLLCAVMTAVILLLQVIPVMVAPSVLVIRGDAKETDWEAVKKCVFENTKSAKQKMESFRLGQMEIIFEVKVKEDAKLLSELQEFAGVQGVNLLSHDGEFRI